MSVTSVGLKNLTSLIYQAMEGRTAAGDVLRAVLGDPTSTDGRIDAARRRVSYEGAFLAGLIKAWETVTGEMWGEALLGWRQGRD